ncbi:uncharacterized protein LOC112520357 isoform X1 [Cynara cardunculus var. scolymus]|uniref:uncharacterized protein LOC112520357 isoform X1 n=2 Tax=Cynara cardunculus var. scolymus TaxID=59895 RepID=UPI000D6297C3|nr:uncharacterized protein LOC112520357 isoform X1 [Cynara cardunculus var. scolymus]XP_024984483.1 uncharacterized protein LOC112520357 isoform X1 [Cynara cardunculus var. scolymus]
MYMNLCSFCQLHRLVGKSFFCLVSETYCALMHWVMENLKDKLRSLFHSRGCLGCPKVPFMTTGKKTTGASKNDSATNKASMVQDFWSSSTYEMDNSAAQSQLSASSVSLSNPTLDGHCSSGSNPPEFVNRGRLLWNQTRQQWIGEKVSGHRKKAQEPAINWKATYDNLLGTNKPFPRPVPLREMVNFLVDVWEEEGLYD